MVEDMKNNIGNPHSRTHFYGWKAEEAVEIARRQVASLIKANEKEIILPRAQLKVTILPLRALHAIVKIWKNHIITVKPNINA